MPEQAGTQLAQIIRTALAEFLGVCAGVDEATASRAPEGRWSPKEVVSHLMGPDGIGLLPMFRSFLDEDEPLIEIIAADAFLTPARQAMGFAQLTQELQREYEALAAFAGGLDAEQLGRRARIPLFKDSPLGERPSLEAVLGGIGQYHLKMHTEHLREILAELAGT